MRKQSKTPAARLGDRVANQAERLGGYLQRSSSDKLVQDAENLARKKPWLVMAAAGALGFIGSRSLKASSSRRHRRQNSSQQQVPQPAEQVPDDTAATPGVAPRLPSAPQDQEEVQS